MNYIFRRASAPKHTLGGVLEDDCRATMGILRDVVRDQDKSDKWPRRAEKNAPPLEFFRQRIRFNGGSNVSIPLGIVLLFPLLVAVLIVVLFVRTPGSDSVQMPETGTPPSIRYHSLMNQLRLTLISL